MNETEASVFVLVVLSQLTEAKAVSRFELRLKRQWRGAGNINEDPHTRQYYAMHVCETPLAATPLQPAG